MNIKGLCIDNDIPTQDSGDYMTWTTFNRMSWIDSQKKK
jgi:hypothetical protein